MEKIVVENLYKVFGDQPDKAMQLLNEGLGKETILEKTGMTVGVDNASFSIQAGEIFVVMGLFGSGKSTIVRMLNRLIEPTAGNVLVDGKNVMEMNENELVRFRLHNMSMLFQSFALMPHLSVLDNAAFGLELAGVDKHKRNARAKDALNQVGLAGWEESFPSQLSGGMQQRVGLARGLAVDPHIRLMDDFKRAEVKKAFDNNGDGKAELTACPPGWGCENVIAHHMDVYDLKDHINPAKASYEAGMASALGAYKSGEPIFFYTWAPNWTIFKLKPGKDVMWINVPKIIPKESQKSSVERMSASGIEGAVSDPVKLGFVVSGIRSIANKKFIKKNPAAKKFFEVLTLPLIDINEQNTRMNEGEKSQKDIERHVDEWIAKNKVKWNGWLEAARKAAM